MVTPAPAAPPKSSFWDLAMSLPPEPKPKVTLEMGMMVVPLAVTIGLPTMQSTSTRSRRPFIDSPIRL